MSRQLAHWRWLLVASLMVAVWGVKSVQGDPVSDIRSTKHNFSTTKSARTNALPSGRTIYSTTESEVCVFCHTPHAANGTIGGPLWNRNPKGGLTYTPYDSTSLDAATPAFPSATPPIAAIQAGFTGQPQGSSKLCLSCHDGAIAIGTVINKPGSGLGNGTIDAGTGSLTTMPTGGGVSTGFTRQLGGANVGTGTVDLSNDHPISVTYSDGLVTADGELRATGGTVVALPTKTNPKPKAKLEPTDGGSSPVGQIQCASCHDPHTIELDTANFGTVNKFLRLRRFQGTQGGTDSPTSDTSFSATRDISCLACHQKTGWSVSAHAAPDVANEIYDTSNTANTSSSGRQFVAGTTDNQALPVWRAACLNCHDTHTVTGARRLLREGVSGSNPAIEQTCYQCHSASTVILKSGGTAATGADTATVNLMLPDASNTNYYTVPNIAYEFSRTVHMPISGTDQKVSPEAHSIRTANFVECRKTLGDTDQAEVAGTHLSAAQKTICDALTGSNNNRHVECTDCHNPHRVRRGAFFTTLPQADNASNYGTRRTHVPGAGTNSEMGNVISGVLRGTWGVEPTWTAGVWPKAPGGFAVKYGNPTATDTNGTTLPSTADAARSNSYMTREYQLCFKCHSNYAFANGPARGNSPGGATASASANGLANWTNVAAEFNVNATDPPSTTTDQGEKTNTSVTPNENSGTACGANYGSDCDPSPTGPKGDGTNTKAGPGDTNNHRSWHPAVWPTGRDQKERGSTSWNNLRYPFDKTKAGRLTMHCSDCHGHSGSWTQNSALGTNDGGPNLKAVQGPHGSDQPFLLKGKWDDTIRPNNVGGNNSSGGICGRCHDPAGATSGFAGGAEASHAFEGKTSFPCVTCHIAIPHGWKNKAFLVNLNCVTSEGGTGYDDTCKAYAGTLNGTSTVDLAPYYYKARLRVASWARSGTWQKANCGTGSETWMSCACGLGC